jgi:hypothetical protein
VSAFVIRAATIGRAPPEPPPVLDFYDRHPINEAQGLEALRRRGRDLRALVPEDLCCTVSRRTDKGLYVGYPLGPYVESAVNAD